MNTKERIQAVEQLDQELKFVKDRFEYAVWQASRAGCSLREIAGKTAFSVETIRTAIRRVELAQT